MPRDPNYWANNAPTKTVTTSTQSPSIGFPLMQQNTKKPIEQASPVAVKTNDQKQYGFGDIRNLSDTNPLKYLPYEFGAGLLAGNKQNKLPEYEVWSNLSFKEQQKVMGPAMQEFGTNMIKSLPAEIVKTPIRMGASLFDFLSTGMEKAGLIRKEFSFPDTFNLPLVGEVKTYKRGYEDWKATGSPAWAAALGTVSQVAGDIAIGLSAAEAGIATIKPKVKVVGNLGIAEDFRPLQAKQVGEVRQAMADIKAKLMSQEPKTLYQRASQNTSNVTIRLSRETAARYKGTPDNTVLVGTPKGKGMIEYNVVQVKKGTLQSLYEKFGRSKVVSTQEGLGVVVDRVTVPSQLVEGKAPSTSIIPASEGIGTEIASSQSNLLSEGLRDFSQPATIASQGQKFTPALMQKPIKGMEETPVTETEITQIKNVQKDTGLPDEAIESIARVVTGKDNLNLLTKKEAFDVSETIRIHGKVSDPTPWQNISYGGTSIIARARDRFDTVQRQFGVPLHDEMYIPMTQGLRLSKNAAREWQNQDREVMGKYSGTKFGNERKAITRYVQGDTSAITQNSSFSPEVKADLVKIGDYFIEDFKKILKEDGITTRFEGAYASQIRKLGTVYNLYKTNDLPAEYRPFFEHTRDVESLNELEEDILAIRDIYHNARAKSKFVKDPLKHSIKLINSTKDLRSVYADANNWLQEVTGYQDGVAEFLNEAGRRLSEKTKGFIPSDITKQVIDLAMTNSYAGALGLPRIDAPIRNMVQQFMNYAEFGPEIFAKTLKYMKDPAIIKEMQDKGFLVEMGVPYGEELAQQSGHGIIGKSIDGYKRFSQMLLKPYSSSEAANRIGAYKGVEIQLRSAWSKLESGKIDYKQFENEINMDGYSSSMQGLLRKKFQSGKKKDLDEALDLMRQSKIDDTQFPYRKGEEGSIFYGMKGKIGLQFGQWTSEYVQTLWTSWARRGQWMKIIRLVAAGEALKRSVKDALGIDVSKWVNTGPMESGVPLGPIAKAGIASIQMLGSMGSDNAEEVNKHWKEITQALKLYGGPIVGVGVNRFKKLKDSVNTFEKGIIQSPDPEKPFGIWSNQGKLIRWVSFYDLMIDSLGFTDQEEQNFSSKINMVTGAEQQYKNHVDEAMKYLINGKPEKFDQTVQKYGIIISDISAKMKSYQVPLDQRIYERLPIPLKMKYAPLFYPQQ